MLATNNQSVDCAPDDTHHDDSEQIMKEVMKKNRSRLREIFEIFSRFGQRDVPSHHSQTSTQKSKDPFVMDGARFAKFCRDTGITDGKSINNTEVDLTFSKVKSKAERKINFQQFQMAICLLAGKKCKYENRDEIMVLKELVGQVSICGTPAFASTTVPVSPKLTGVTNNPSSRHSMSSATIPSEDAPILAPRYSLRPEKKKSLESDSTGPSVFDRLTDSKHYTGTQKQRFQMLNAYKRHKGE